MHAFRGDLEVPHDCVVRNLELLKNVGMFTVTSWSEDVLNIKSFVGHDGIASVTVRLQTTAFHNLSVAGRPTVGVRDVRHLSSRGDSDQNFGRVTFL